MYRDHSQLSHHDGLIRLHIPSYSDAEFPYLIRLAEFFPHNEKFLSSASSFTAAPLSYAYCSHSVEKGLVGQRDFSSFQSLQDAVQLEFPSLTTEHTQCFPANHHSGLVTCFLEQDLIVSRPQGGGKGCRYTNTGPHPEVQAIDHEVDSKSVLRQGSLTVR